MVFCSIEKGYWGRDHGNGEGIPLDVNSRTTVGVYPSGGKFDGDEFESVLEGTNGGGLGITPIMLASLVECKQKLPRLITILRQH